MEITLWSGHVAILKDENGHAFIRFQKDGDSAPTDYHPQGFFENKAVNGLVGKLMGQ